MKILIILNITDIYICSSFQSLNSALLWLAPRSEMSLPRSRHQATRESRNVKKVTEAERKYAEPGNIRVMCHVSRVTCHMSRVMCNVSRVMCHNHVTIFTYPEGLSNTRHC